MLDIHEVVIIDKVQSKLSFKFWRFWEILMMSGVAVRGVQEEKVNTLSLRWNVCHFADDIFKHISLNKTHVLIEISLKSVPKCLMDNKPALGQIMAWLPTGDKPLSEPVMGLVHWRIYASLDHNESNCNALCLMVAVSYIEGIVIHVSCFIYFMRLSDTNFISVIKEAEIKSLQFCRHFQINFSWMSIVKLILISPKFVTNGPINYMVLDHMMAWRLTGNKPLCEPMMAKLTDAYRHSASTS